LNTKYEVIILGAGIMGSATAHKLSKTQKKILLLEQFPIQHNNGSSHGQTRIIRQTYTEKHFSELMKSAYKLWNDFEKEIGDHLILKTGGIDFGPENSENLIKTVETCKKLGIPFQKFNNRELNAKFPMFQLSDEYFGIVQESSGIVLANKALSSFQNQATNNHVKVSENEKVIRIKIDTSKIIVETTKETYHTEKLVLTSGMWTNINLESTGIKLDLDIWKLSFAYWFVTNIDIFSPEKFPIFIAWEDDPIYGFPLIENQSAIKIAPHFTFDNNLSPQTKENIPNMSLISRVGDYINNNFKYVKSSPLDPQSCYYTMTKDENFILDFHPDSDQVVIGAGFSGHGFKFAPLVGEILSNLVQGQKSIHKIDQFSIKPHLLI
jgi:monomeric sarcosine oxidase